MSIKDSNFNLQISMNLIRKKTNEDELNLKLKQVREVTNCNEEFAIVTLHDCNYNVEYAINKILTHEFPNEGEWKTKKGKQKKMISKDKILDKNQDATKEKIKVMQDINIEKDLENFDKKSNYQIKKEFTTFGKTFKNFNLPNRLNSNYIIHDPHKRINVKPAINFLISGKWNEKTIIIENTNFSPMSVKDIVMLKSNKNTICDRQESTIVNEKPDQSEDLSIVFKTHCTTKPPPKVLCSLVAPVQIINKTITHPSTPKFKFGDTDFYEDCKTSDQSFNSNPNTNLISSESKFVDIEDNSIIKVGPPQKISNNQSNCSFSPTLFNPNNYFNQNSLSTKGQSNITNNIKPSEFSIKKPNEIVDFSHMSIQHQHPTTAIIPNCTSNLSSINHFNSTMSPKELVTNQQKAPDMFLNHTSPLNFPHQPPPPNVNHVKSTIYLLPNMMMNAMNGMYMTVNNPIPSSALSPPMAPLPSQFSMPQPQPVYFEESLQPDELANKNILAIRNPYNHNPNTHSQTRNTFQRYKKPGGLGEMPDDLVAMKSADSFAPKQLSQPQPPPPQPQPAMKVPMSAAGIPLNSHNVISKPITPFNYPHPVYISPGSVAASHNHSQMFINNPSINSSSFSHYPLNFPPTQQESNSNDNIRKRMQNGSFHGKTWS